MVDMLPLPHWTALANLDDDAVPLMSTALLIARDEYPQLNAELYDTLVQSHVEHLRREVDAIDLWPLKMAAVNRYLFDELGYSGNHDEYYDPRNSYLNQVFERRLGQPDFAGDGANRSRPPAGHPVGGGVVSRPFPGASAGR